VPELPEAETTLRKLTSIIRKTIAGFSADLPRGLRITKSAAKIAKDIKNRKIAALTRTGKVIFLWLTSKDSHSNALKNVRINSVKSRRRNVKKEAYERVLALHQGMSGRLLLKRRANHSHSPPRKETMDEKYVRARVIFEDGRELLFKDPRKFGVIWYGSPREIEEDRYLAALGPDGLTVTFQEFKHRLQKHKGMIKPLLLRQDTVAGIGNIIADETLWEARIHPKRRLTSLTPQMMQTLFKALKRVLLRSIRAGGTTLRDWKHPDGKSGKFQNYMRIYGRDGKPCIRCGNKVRRIIVGSRGTWICPMCQKYAD